MQDGGARKLLKRYRTNPELTLDVLLLAEVTNRRNRDRLKRQMSEASTNYSLWLNASSKTGRDLRQFTAKMRDDEGIAVQSKFSF